MGLGGSHLHFMPYMTILYILLVNFDLTLYSKRKYVLKKLNKKDQIVVYIYDN